MPRRRPHVTVVGLGPAGPELVPDATASLLEGAGTRAFLRTARHPAAAGFDDARPFDDLYESAGTFDEVYAAIVETLVTAATDSAPDPVVYAVPGSPLVAERSVELLRAERRVDLTVLPALSFLDLVWAALGVDPMAEGVCLVDAAAFGAVAAGGRGPFLVAQCWSRHVLSEVKLSLADDGPDPPRPVLLHHLGLADEVLTEVEWWDLDRTVEADHLTSLWVPALPVPATDPGATSAPGAAAAGEETARLVTLMDTLRARCPWDRAQTHTSLMPHLVEECYEVLDALASVTAAPDTTRSEDFAHLEEELGDLLFQIVFHARLAEEEGTFDLAGVARGVHDKLVHRHPHVFGDLDTPSAAQVVSNWEEIKKSEKGRSSVTEGIPTGLPALMLTTKLARKARAVGLEPSDTPERAASVLESLAARATHAAPHPDEPLSGASGDLEHDMGELLFAVAVLAQRLGIDAEQTLRHRALELRAEIRVAEGVPDPQVGNR